MTSLTEGILFFIAMIFFSGGLDNSVWYLVLSLFHVARAIFGFAMGRVIPSSYDFVEKLEFKGDKQLEYRLVRPELTRKVQTLLLEYYDDFEKLALVYTLLACISFVLDIISFFAVYGILASRLSDLPDIVFDAGLT